MFEKKFVILDGENIIYRREKITYEKLCKVIKRKSRVVIVIINKNIFVKKIKTIKDSEIEKNIESEILINDTNYLINYEKNKKANETTIYAIKGSELINTITDRFINFKIYPIEILIKNLLIKNSKEGKSIITFMNKDYKVNICEGQLNFNEDILEENCFKGRLVLNNLGGKII